MPARAQDIIDGRRWSSGESHTHINGIGSTRAEEIRKSGLICEN